MKNESGVMLAGGRVPRFRRDKAGEPVGKRDMVEWALGALLPQIDLWLVAVRGAASTPSDSDRLGLGFGPLSSLAGAHLAAQTSGCSNVLSAACDPPFVASSNLQGRKEGKQAVFSVSCRVIGLWPVSLGRALEQHLTVGGMKSVGAWARAVGTKSARATLTIANLNYAGDLGEMMFLHG